MSRIWQITLAGACIAMSSSGAIAAHAPCAAVPSGGSVGGLTLGQLLAHWTGAATYSPCPIFDVYDFNEDCRVNGLDLGTLLAAWGATCGPNTAQLAGNPLPTYPFFEYVSAFNQAAPINVAIDPTRFPAIVGDTCDIYVVTHKTPGQWSVNPALVDVTSGGSQTQTIAAGTIQANTFLISGGSALNGTVGTQIGVAYDVVLDCNQNGQLDVGDYIDGLSAEAGLYVVRDTAAPGPFATSVGTATVSGVTPGFTSERIFYPTTIASMGQVPLIVVSHGNGHSYLWYDHIGNHMSSYGYIVMSHQNNTVPGVASAATTTFEHTNAILAQQGTLLGGVLSGHIDQTRIMWIGHSRGGEGVTIAYDRVFDGVTIPVGWTIASLRLVSSMAPVDYLGPTSSNPHGANYHLWVGTADSDVSGCTISDDRMSYHLHDRATDFRQSISLYGAGHGDFHNSGGSSVASGPCLIGRAKTHAIMRGYLLPLVKRYFELDIPSKEFLWRQWERFRPIGAPAESPCPPPNGSGVDVVVNLMYRDGPVTGNFKLDDYQAQFATGVSSSGGAVAFSVANLVEDKLRDTNTDFTWTGAEPMNGMTMASAADDSRGAVFDWNAPAFYEFAVPSAQQDFSDDAFLSFRACQGTRHPNTIAALEDLTFDVVLRDSDGATSRININAYGGGVEEPYQRSGCGSGAAGWGNEFETIRIRLSDFLNNASGGSGLDLASIVAVRFEFAAPGGGTSAVGRVGIDEIEVTQD